MQWLTQFLNRYFELPQRRTGSDVRWSIDWPPVSNVMIGLSLAVALACLFWLLRFGLKERSTLPRSTKCVLVTCRVLATFLMLLMLWQVNLLATSNGRARIVILLDISASMGLGDDSSSVTGRNRTAQSFRNSATTRLDLMKQAWLDSAHPVLNDVVGDYDIEFFQFDSEIHPLHPKTETDEDSVSFFRRTIRNLKAEGSRTDIPAALDAVLHTHRGNPPEAIVLVSDGNSDESSDAAMLDVQDQLSRHGVPVFAVGVGSSQSRADLSIEHLQFEPVNFPDTVTPVLFDLSATGTQAGKQRVTLQRLNETKVLDSVELHLNAENPTGTGQVTIPGLPPGRYEFELNVLPAPGESDLRNNSRQFRMQIRESPLSVLLVDQQPRWEFRHLKNSLERDHDLQLSTFLLDQDLAYAKEDRSALARLPADFESLSVFDAIILGDLDWDRLTPEFIDALPKLVSERGVGLIWIPGNIYSTGEELPEPLKALMPATLTLRESEQTGNHLWKLSPTVAGRAHPIWSSRSIDSKPRNKADTNWALVPGVYAPPWNLTLAAGATVLLQGRVQEDSVRTVLPMLISQHYGSGQVLLQLFDESWRWRWIRNGDFYRRYWSQSVRFTAKRRMLDQLPQYELVLDRDEFDVGEPVELRLFINHPGEQKNQTHRVQINDGTRSREVILTPQKGDRQVCTATLSNLPAGKYTAILEPTRHETPSQQDQQDGTEKSDAVPNPKTIGKSPLTTSPQRVTAVVTNWIVKPVDRERSYQPMQSKLLRELATKTGGRFFTIGQLDRLTNSLPQRSPGTQQQLSHIALWKRPEVLFMLILVVSIEWVLRRLRGVL